MTSELVIARTMKDIDRMDRDPRLMERAVARRDLDFELERAQLYSYVWDYKAKKVVKLPNVHGGSGMGNGTYAEVIYASTAPGTAKNTFTTEFMINDTTAMGAAPVIPQFYFAPQVGLGKRLRIIAHVIQLGTASTPPTWQVIHRLNPVVTPAVPPTGPNIGGMTAGITGTTTASSLWRSELDVQLTAFGAAGNNSTLRGTGMVWSPTGFVSPFMAALLGGGASPGTVATFDYSLLNTLTYGVVCGTSLAANQVQLIDLTVIGLN